MAEMFENKPPKKRSAAGLIIGAIIGVLFIGGAIFWLSRTPTIEDQTAKLREGSLREGSPQFAELAKNIQVARDDNNTVESPKGTGKISMYIRGNVYNKTAKTITLLEVDVSVIDQQNQPIRNKKVLVVPVQQPPIAPGESTPITCTLDGFDRKDDRANINFKVTAIKVQD